jgi:hypothetical protein
MALPSGPVKGTRMHTTCRHCTTGTVSRPRGLCWACYYTPGIRDCYPSTSKYGRRGHGPAGYRLPPLPDPTDAQPGSPAKVAILEARCAAGEQLFHPEDAEVGDYRETTLPHGKYVNARAARAKRTYRVHLPFPLRA